MAMSLNMVKIRKRERHSSVEAIDQTVVCIQTNISQNESKKHQCTIQPHLTINTQCNLIQSSMRNATQPKPDATQLNHQKNVVRTNTSQPSQIKKKNM